jgi:hypothetical protein
MSLHEENKYIIIYEHYDKKYKYIHQKPVQPLTGRTDKSGSTEVVLGHTLR